jgi:CRP/FNR family cyclic AMP-dependent transcriptional regulator
MSKSSIVANTEFLTYNSGEFIFREGETGKTMFSIIEGKVEIRAKDKTVYIAGPGEILGEMSLIDNKPRSATAIAKSTCKLALIDEKRFDFLIQQTPMFITQIMKALTDRLRHMNSEP